MRFVFPWSSVLMATVLFLPTAHSDDNSQSHLMILEAHTFATAPGAPTAGGYVTIMNHSAQDERLIGGHANFVEKFEIHEMKMDGDVMKMRRVENGLPIPAGGSVVLQRGGYHIMFMGLSAPLAAGESVTSTLLFEQGGEVEVTFEVRQLSEMAHDGEHKMKDHQSKDAMQADQEKKKKHNQ